MGGIRRLSSLVSLIGLTLVATPACSLYVVPEDPRSAAALLHSLLGGGSGASSSNALTACPVTDYDALFTDTAAPLTGVGNGVVSWPSSNFGDVDGDGDQDLVLTGHDGTTQTAKLYRNDGAGNFSENTGAGLTGVENGSSALGDVDGDGDLDLVITGDTDGADTIVATLYRNDGAGNFSDAGAGLTGVEKSTTHFLDVDGDGDLDLLMTGDTTGSPVTRSTIVYTNDGAGNFTNTGNRGLDDSNFNALDIGDVDGDGDLDLLIIGTNGAIFAKLFTNDGSGNFADAGAGFMSSIFDIVILADLDGDGDLDAVLRDSTVAHLTVYRNDGSGNFSIDTRFSLRDIDRGRGIAGDVDNDGDQDLIITGQDESGSGIALLYVNRGDGTFIEAEPGLTGVQYSAVDLADTDGDGDLDLVIAGEGPAANVYRNNLDAAPSIAGVDCNAIQPTSLFTLQSTALPDYYDGSFDFGDIDGDGDLDLLATGRLSGGGYEARIWRNDGNFTFTDIGAGLPGFDEGDGAFGDVDGDGDLDAVISGQDGGTRYSRLYRNDGSGNFTLDAAVSAGLTDLDRTSVDLADLDGDGDLDLLLTGENGGTYYAIVYRNDGTGSFSDAGAGLTGVYRAGTALTDLDGDGDLDLVITGYDGSNPGANIYRNDGGLAFTNMGVSLTGVFLGETDAADLDGDGDPDLIITGTDGSNGQATVYRNDGNFAFTDIGAGLSGVSNQTGTGVVAIDLENDGDLDLVYSGYVPSATNKLSRVYLNDGAMNFTRVNPGLAALFDSALSAADVDGDGDLDIFQSGNSWSSRVHTVVYRNNTR